MESPPPYSIEVEPQGDLTLIVGQDAARILVSRATMRRICAAFDSILEPNRRAESTENEFRLPSDSPQAMAIIAQIAHLQFKDLPSYVDAKDVLQLAVAADKYSMASTLVPFYPAWKSKLNTLPLVDQLFVMYALKDQTTFLQKVIPCIANMNVNKATGDVHFQDKPLSRIDKLYRSPMLEKLLEAYEVIEGRFLNVLRKYASRLEEWKGCNAPAGTPYRYECNLLLRGSFKDSLRKQDLHLDSILGNELSPSLSTLHQRICDIRVRWQGCGAPGAIKPAYFREHARCDFTSEMQEDLVCGPSGYGTNKLCIKEVFRPHFEKLD
ncbi:MAG: hypothetical protein M1831_005956 [Alyxoria varia]|nr:MAG: hypothetical protein M1831_005956 [Alyxoria varia]